MRDVCIDEESKDVEIKRHFCIFDQLIVSKINVTKQDKILVTHFPRQVSHFLHVLYDYSWRPSTPRFLHFFDLSCNYRIHVFYLLATTRLLPAKPPVPRD